VRDDTQTEENICRQSSEAEACVTEIITQEIDGGEIVGAGECLSVEACPIY